MTPSTLPGEPDPVDIDGSPLPWAGLATSRPKGNPKPRPSDLSAHEHGFVSGEEDEIREAARQMLRDAVARGVPAARAKTAIVVGVVVELGSIRSRIEAQHHARRQAEKAASA